MSTFLYRLGRFAARRPWVVLGAWLLLAVVVVASNATAGKEFEDTFTVPGTDSDDALVRASFKRRHLFLPLVKDVEAHVQVRGRHQGGCEAFGPLDEADAFGEDVRQVDELIDLALWQAPQIHVVHRHARLQRDAIRIVVDIVDKI